MSPISNKFNNSILEKIIRMEYDVIRKYSILEKIIRMEYDVIRKYSIIEIIIRMEYDLYDLTNKGRC